MGAIARHEIEDIATLWQQVAIQIAGRGDRVIIDVYDEARFDVECWIGRFVLPFEEVGL